MTNPSTTTWTTRILLLCICLHSLVLALTNPLGEAPDEPAHMEYVRFVVDEQRLPRQCAAPCVSDVDGEGHQPPLAYLVYALAVAPLIERTPRERTSVEQTPWVGHATNPDFLWHGGADPQALVHGSRDYWPWRGNILAWRLMRIVSVVLITLAAWLTALIAQRLGTPVTGLVALLLIALTPQTGIIGSTVSNDPLLLVLSAGLVFFCITTRTLRDMLAVGTLLGLTLVTKQSAIVLLPLLLVAALRLRGWGQRVLALGLGTLVTVAVSAWWYVRNARLYGDVFGLQLFTQTYAGSPLAWNDPQTWQNAFSQLLRSAWGLYGWMSIPLPAAWYGIGTMMTLLGLCGVGLRLRSGLPGQSWRWAGLISLGCVLWLGAFAHTVGAVAWQTRLLAPVLPLIVIIIAAGYTRGLAWAPQPRTLSALGVAALMLQLGLWWGIVLPRFHADMPDPATTATPLNSPRDAVFAARGSAGGIALLDLDAPATIAPGDTVDLRLRWQVYDRPSIDWQLYLVVRDVYKREYHRVTQPLHARIPTSRWTPGDRLISHHQITVPADLAEGFYMIQIGLVDTRSPLRAEKRDHALNLTGESVFLPFTVGNPPLP